MDNRTQNEEYARIGRELIETEPELEEVKISDITICYLSSDFAKTKNGRIVHGEAERIKDKYKWAIPCDATITLYEPNNEDLSEKQIRLVIFHELLHIGITTDIETGDDKVYIKPHDIEDFRILIERYGLDWAEPGNDDYEIIKG